MNAPMHQMALWHSFAKSGDKQQLDWLIADDCVFHSPVVHTPQVGKAITMKYLRAAHHILSTAKFKYTGEWSNETGAILQFECELDGVYLNGVDMIEWNEAGRVTSFKVMVRPLKGMNMLHQKMGEMLMKP
jgi:hypothetical protein